MCKQSSMPQNQQEVMYHWQVLVEQPSSKYKVIKNLWLNLGVIPTMFDSFGYHSILSSLGHCHSIENVKFVNVLFTRFIKFNNMGTKIMVIDCLEASDDSSISWLHKWCHIGLKALKINICWLTSDTVIKEIINKQTNMPILLFHPKI
jgi:hypothetical protein